MRSPRGALEVVAKMREALGGDAKLAAVSSLSLSGTSGVSSRARDRIRSRCRATSRSTSCCQTASCAPRPRLRRSRYSVCHSPGRARRWQRLGLDAGRAVHAAPQESAPGGAAGPVPAAGGRTLPPICGPKWRVGFSSCWGVPASSSRFASRMRARPRRRRVVRWCST